MIEEVMEKAPKTLGTMLDYLGLDASVKAEEKNGNILLTVFSEEAGRIIGRKGLALHSLQLLLNRVVSKGNRESPRIMINVDGYQKTRRPRNEEGTERTPREEDGRDRRPPRRNFEEKDAAVRKKALDAVKEVKRWGDDVTLAPMNPKERRIVHVALEKEEGVIAESFIPEGEKGNFKSIKISEKK